MIMNITNSSRLILDNILVAFLFELNFNFAYKLMIPELNFLFIVRRNNKKKKSLIKVTKPKNKRLKRIICFHYPWINLPIYHRIVNTNRNLILNNECLQFWDKVFIKTIIWIKNTFTIFHTRHNQFLKVLKFMHNGS